MIETVFDKIGNMAAINETVLKSSASTLTFAHDVLAASEAIQNRAVNLESSIHKLLQRIATS